MDLAAIDLGEFGKQLFLRLLEQTSTEGTILSQIRGVRRSLREMQEE